MFLSFLSGELLRLVRSERPPSLAALSCYLKRRGIRRQMKTLRKDFATDLRNQSIPYEMVDLLQGRVSPTVFGQHYYRPGLKALSSQVLAAVRPMEEELLKVFA